jgi:uncharacterized protein YbgA (DUF1722 family)
MARYCQNHSRAELLGLIDRYRRGLIPRIAPIRRIREYVRLQKIGDLEGQTYLEPYPEELMLRNQS